MLPTIMTFLLATAIGYVIGSIPVGFLLVKALTGEDIRQHGSGRTGGTNVGRILGPRGFVVTMVLDGLKAFVAVLLVRVYVSSGVSPDMRHWPEVLAGLASVAGHNWPVFLGFHGGAGFSPTVGAAGALWGWSVLIAALLGGFALLFSGIFSVGSIVAVLTVVAVFLVRALLGVAPWAYAGYALGAAIMTIWALMPNIRRLRDGTEPRTRLGSDKVRRR